MAQTITAVSNGNWGNSGTWNPARQPANGDSIIIPNNREVLFNINSGPGSGPNDSLKNAVVYVYGILRFSQGEKLYLACSSQLIIDYSGKIVANNAGVKIDWCNGGFVWNANQWPDFTTNGPYFIGNSLLNPYLPVDVLFFQAKQNYDETILTWATASEKNNDYFILERAVASDEFERITIVNGSGNSNIPIYYSYTDNVIGEGTVYYRLSQYDYDGTNEMLGVIAVQPNQKFISDYLQFTNPVSASETFEIILLQEITGCIKLLSSGGRKIFSTTIHPATGKVQIPNLNPGFYLLHLETADMNHVSKLIVY